MERDEGRACHNCVVAGEYRRVDIDVQLLVDVAIRTLPVYRKGSCLRPQVYNLCLQQMATPSLQAGTMHAWISMDRPRFSPATWI